MIVRSVLATEHRDPVTVESRFLLVYRPTASLALAVDPDGPAGLVDYSTPVDPKAPRRSKHRVIRSDLGVICRERAGRAEYQRDQPPHDKKT